MRAPTILKARHFDRADTRLVHGGLVFRVRIRQGDREHVAMQNGDDELLARIESFDRETLVVANPRAVSVAAHRQELERDQRRAFGESEKISINYGLPRRYDRKWKRSSKPDGDSESQMLVLVAFQSSRPVGYSSVDVYLSYDRESRSLYTRLDLPMVYVLPRQRGRGLGLDLSAACGMFARDFLRALYRAAPPHTKISPSVHADYESGGGEAFAMHVHGCLEVETDMLTDFGKRPSIRIDSPELDAGY